MKRVMLIATLMLLIASPASAQIDTTIHADTTHHPTRARMGAAFGIGFVTGLAGVFVAWAPGGLAGYFSGTIVGSAMPRATKCGFVKRVGVSFLGALAGGVVSYWVANRTYLAKDAEAVAATIAVGGAPILGSALALRSCDS